jgi:hypothetical protein
MISRKRGADCSEERLDSLIGQALRARVAGACPLEDGWTRLVAQLAARNDRAGSRCQPALVSLRQALAWCCGLVDRVLPLLEIPAAQVHEPRGARIAMHWRWLHLHRVTVRLLC